MSSSDLVFFAVAKPDGLTVRSVQPAPSSFTTSKNPSVITTHFNRYRPLGIIAPGLLCFARNAGAWLPAACISQKHPYDNGSIRGDAGTLPGLHTGLSFQFLALPLEAAADGKIHPPIGCPQMPFRYIFCQIVTRQSSAAKKLISLRE